MEITGVLAVITVLGVGFAAYFAKLWLSAKAELAELAARSEANTDLDQKTALMKAEFEALSQRLLNERAKELTSQHSDSLTQILKPPLKRLIPRKSSWQHDDSWIKVT